MLIFLLRVQHYANQSDVQMAGMLSCALSNRLENTDVAQTSRLISKSVNVSVSNVISYERARCADRAVVL